MLDRRKSDIDKELQLLYEDEKGITDRIQDLLQEKAKLQRQDERLLEAVRHKSKFGGSTT